MSTRSRIAATSVAVLGALASPPADASWPSASKALTTAAAFGATADWENAARAVEALSATCSTLDPSDEFERGDCGARLAALQGDARTAMAVERTYTARIRVVLGEFDFASSRFPLNAVPTVRVLLHDPGQCDAAIIWGGGLGGATLCLFASQPKLKMVTGSTLYRGMMQDGARYWVLDAARPSLTTQTIGEGTARQLRAAVGTSEVPADLTFRWKYEADKCTSDFAIKGSAVHGYCWAALPDLDVSVVWPYDAQQVINQP